MTNLSTEDILNLINSLSQAFATLFAVLLAFLLSIFTAKSSWKQRKKEQIREHQLDSVKTLVHIIQKIDYELTSFVQYREDTIFEMSTMTETQKSNKKNSSNTHLKAKIETLQELKIEFIKELWELKFLKYNDAQIIVIQSYINEFDTVIEKFTNSNNYIDNSNICLSSLSELSKYFNRFIREADDGLTK